MNVPPDRVRRNFSATNIATFRDSLHNRYCAFITLLFVLILPMNANADYRLSAYKATPGFSQIMSEDYSKAATIASTRAPLGPKYAVVTNLCVSEVMVDALDSALQTCNKAIDLVSTYSSVTFSKRDRKESMSEMLSNRGVILALQGNLTEAEGDFTRAVELDSDNANATANLAYLRSKQVASNIPAD